MRFKTEHFFCSEQLLKAVPEVKEIQDVVGAIPWKPEFSEQNNSGEPIKHQAAYNKAFEREFGARGWTDKPLLHTNPRLIGDFGKNDVFVEVQFGNSATLYRDYYKFHFGLMQKKLALAVLVVPTKPSNFFPTRPRSVHNMAEFSLACRYFELLPIPVPIMVVGLLPEN